MKDSRTIHLVYPADDQRKSSPWTVGNNLKEKIGGQFNIEIHEWDANYLITPGANDILIGHPHPKVNTVFRKSFAGPWSRRFVICPFTTNPQQMYFVEPYARRADAFFAICGPTWADKIDGSLYSHLRMKFVHLDMGIDPDDWPPLEREFSQEGQRRFAFIGSSLALKGTPFLEKISSHRPKSELSWIGASSWVRSNAVRIPYLDLNSIEGRSALSQFDFILSPGKSDANPTVLFEAMCLGLIPICTIESGYEDEKHFYLLNYGQIPEAMKLFDHLQNISPDELKMRREENYLFIKNFTWNRFTITVLSRIMDALDSEVISHATARPRGFVLKQFVLSLNSPYRLWRSSRLIKLLENRFYFYSARILKSRFK